MAGLLKNLWREQELNPGPLDKLKFAFFPVLGRPPIGAHQPGPLRLPRDDRDVPGVVGDPGDVRKAAPLPHERRRPSGEAEAVRELGAVRTKSSSP